MVLVTRSRYRPFGSLGDCFRSVIWRNWASLALEIIAALYFSIDFVSRWYWWLRTLSYLRYSSNYRYALFQYRLRLFVIIAFAALASKVYSKWFDSPSLRSALWWYCWYRLRCATALGELKTYLKRFATALGGPTGGHSVGSSQTGIFAR